MNFYFNVHGFFFLLFFIPGGWDWKTYESRDFLAGRHSEIVALGFSGLERGASRITERGEHGTLQWGECLRRSMNKVVQTKM